MARNARPTAAKREREKALIERRQQKAARRQDAKDRKATTGSDRSGDDPDIAHIKLGPQPPADWQVDPDMMRGLLAHAGLEVVDFEGIAMSPTRGLHLSEDLKLNYLVAAKHVG